MTKRIPAWLSTLSATVLAFLVLAAAAAAEPQLGVQLERTHEPLHLGDERLVYEATVVNEAGSRPGVGTELTCRGTPAQGVPWGGNPDPSFTFAWLRDGAPIPGSTAETYVVAPADQGKSIQCVVTGTNDPDGEAGTKYKPIARSLISLPPTVVEPVPTPVPPSGTSGPAFSGPPIAATPSGTATATTGSDLLTEVVTAKGTGTLASGSTVVTATTMEIGEFEALQAVAGTCIPAEATIETVEETGPDTFELTLSKASTCSGPGTLEAGAQPFGLEHAISGKCIPPGTKVIGATNQGPISSTVRHILMDKAATCSEVGMAITATSTLTCKEPTGWSAGSWSYRWLRNGKPIGGATSPTYTVQEEDTKPFSILQCEATVEDAEGRHAVTLSEGKQTRPALPEPYFLFSAFATAAIDFANQTSGEVTLQLELPAGSETFTHKVHGTGWNCTKTLPSPPIHAAATCKRSDVLGPQEDYPSVEVVAALGKDPPQPLVTKAEASGGNAPVTAADEDQYTIPFPRIPFGFKAFETELLDEFGADYTQAGGHPFSAGARIAFNTHEAAEVENLQSSNVNGSPRTVRTQTPPGFVGNPEAIGELCPSISDLLGTGKCPTSSIVGTISGTSNPVKFEENAIFAIEPEKGKPALFAFRVAEFAFTLTPELRPEDGYAIDLVTQPLSKLPEVYTAEAKLCGFGTSVGPGQKVECRGPDDPEALEKPFLTLPTRCGSQSSTTKIVADSWEEPGKLASAEFTGPAVTGCDKVKFEPQIAFKPTSQQADSPTGMEVELTMPTAGLEEKDGIAQANLEGTTVTLPEGMAVNPASANNLQACTLEQLGMSAEGVPNDEPVACPDASKLGTVEATTPILEKPLPGTVYLAKQGSNPFDSLLALYLVIDSPERGILVKLAGKVSPDPATGRLTVTFDDNPQAPIGSVKLRFAGGDRAALINPPRCGNYLIKTEFTPWTAVDPANPTPDEIVTRESSFDVTQGPNGGACPSGGFDPKLSAGLANAQAGATSPFHLRLTREDGTQRLRGVSTTTPPGLSAYLKSLPCCPADAVTGVPTGPGTGAALLASPPCPPGSQIGTVAAGAGAGPDPFFIDTGRVYLGCVYKGAPLSLAIVTPAVSGPFDLGNVGVMTALHLNPQTAQITAVSDPIPTILHGIPLDVRDIRIDIDRPNFTLAPTNCEPLATTAVVTGDGGATANLSDRFQVGGCDKLGFKPNLKLRLKGSPKRGAYQRLTATLTARPGKDANIARASVALPHSIFLAQEHIRTVCTRVQYAADACPAGSIYGKARATSPLVDYPLTGFVYLRSSSNPLPDMVLNLKGPDYQPIEVDLVGRIDSVNGGIRSTFDTAPDAPVSKFTLEMRGGKKSLLVSSRDLCKGKSQRATVQMTAQNGRERDFRPVVGNSCGGKGKAKGKRRG